MIYPVHFEEKTGFSQIRKMMADLCLSECGMRMVEEMTFSDDYQLIIFKTGTTEEFRQILLFDSDFPQQDYFDMIPELERIRLPGTYIEKDALQDLKRSYMTICDILNFFGKKDENRYPLLRSIIKDISADKGLIKRIEKIIDDKGNIRDEASPELAEIRKRMKSLHRNIERQIRQYLVMAKKEGWTEEGVEPTIRNGRSVLPVLATHKRKIKGFIQDESASGQTVYIEPAEVLEANNEIRELESAEKREIIRILTKFTESIRPVLPEVIRAYKMLGTIDFIRAKALFAIKTISHLPVISDEPLIGWKKCISSAAVSFP